jgi:hypothetical protein
MKQIVVTKKSIRRLPRSDRFKGTIEYTTSKGQFRSLTVTRESKAEVTKEINFRVNGLKNGGVPVVSHDPKVKI